MTRNYTQMSLEMLKLVFAPWYFISPKNSMDERLHETQ